MASGQLTDNTRILAEDKTCIPSEDKMCIQSEDKTCIQSEDKTCIQSEDKTCIQSEDKTCIQSEDKTCIQSEDKTCIRLVSMSDDHQRVSEQVFYQYNDQDYYEPKDPSLLQKCSNAIIRSLESFFYSLGLVVARHPFLTIFLSLLVCGVCGIGMNKFEQTTDDAKLWVPKTSRVLPEKHWVDTYFPEQTRFTSYIITAPNVLSPKVINMMYDMYIQAQQIQLPHRKDLNNLCVKTGLLCHVRSILELWKYNGTKIRSLTLSDVITKINTPMKYSPVFGTVLNLENMLGEVSRDIHGNITGARATSMLWVLHNKQEWDDSAMEWERKMIQFGNAPRPNIDRTFVYATRTFDDEGYGAVNADVSLLTAGFIIVFIFIIMALGRFNMVEHKLYVSLAGILSIGLAILFCYGLAMAFGFIYGPIHALMPFLLLGIGVDDMFVIVGAWRNLSTEEQKRPVEEKIAVSLKHAGVSITVTSITDIVAFGIGGTTVIPALSAFCAYAALGILGLYGLVTTFFVAVLTLDQMRIEQKRNAFLFCISHHDYVPNRFSQMDLIPSFVEKIYAPALMKKICKVSIVVATVALTSVNIWSFSMLRQDFDLYNYLPSDSYATDYIQAQKKYYPDKGYEAAIYCDGFDLYTNMNHLTELAREVKTDPYIQNGTVNCWYTSFMDFIKNSQELTVVAARNSSGYPSSSRAMDLLLPFFLLQQEGRSYGQYLKFDNVVPPKLTAFYIPLVHTRQESSAGDIVAMESLRTILDKTQFKGGRCFSYGFKYLNNETNRVLKGELYRNLALAAVCVFVVTLLLIANLWTSILVFTCVVFTVIDVTGTLQFWGVSIDTASSILIILCVGLAVDYSAHVGHMFMTLSGSKEARARATLVNIGPAVLNGGFSTLLAFVLLADSKSYGFALFFRVFMTVVIFGLYHGLVYLPVILSWVGPAPYQSADKVFSDETPQHKKDPSEETLMEKDSRTKGGVDTYPNGNMSATHIDQLIVPAESKEGGSERDTVISPLNPASEADGYSQVPQNAASLGDIVVHELVDETVNNNKDECGDSNVKYLKMDDSGNNDSQAEHRVDRTRRDGSLEATLEQNGVQRGVMACAMCMLERAQSDIKDALEHISRGEMQAQHADCERHGSRVKQSKTSNTASDC